MELIEPRIQGPQLINNIDFQKWIRKITKQANNTQKVASAKMEGIMIARINYNTKNVQFSKIITWAIHRKNE